jgi:hypothetical protein
VAGGQGAVLLEPGEAALDDVAAGADLQVAGRWAAAARALCPAAGDLVDPVGAGEGDAAGAQRSPVEGGSRPGRRSPGPGGAAAAPAGTGHRDLIEQRQQLRVIPGLTGSTAQAAVLRRRPSTSLRCAGARDE